MRRSLIFVAGFMAVALVGCSSGNSVSIEIFHGEGAAYGTNPFRAPFRASGAAVDEAAVCENGTTTQDHVESPEGEIITEVSGHIRLTSQATVHASSIVAGGCRTTS